MKFLLSFCILVLSISCASQHSGQEEAYLAESIWVVFQDSKSIYWFGSNRQGVFTYDGTSIKQYTTKNGLVNNTIRGIQEDRFGNIYVETASGISKYDGDSFSKLIPVKSPENKWSLSPTDLWFGYDANHVRRYDGETLHELKLPEQDLQTALGINPLDRQEDPYIVYGVDKDKDGNLWLGTVLAGAFRYDGDSFIWVGEPELSIRSDGTVPGVRSMLEDKNGGMWLSNVLHQYQIDSTQTSGYSKLTGLTTTWEPGLEELAYFNSGLVDTEGNLWMTKYGGTVWKYDGEKLVEFTVSHVGEKVLIITIYQDKDGTLWLGSDNYGVFRFDGEAFQKFEVRKK